MIARSVESLEAAKAEVEALGGKAFVLPCDVADAEAVEAAAERVETELGPIDVWVNDAMMERPIGGVCGSVGWLAGLVPA